MEEGAKELGSSAEALFHAVIEASPIPFALNDEHQNITYLNPAFVRTFGYTRRDIPTLADWWPRAYPDPEYRGWVSEQWASRLAAAQRTGDAFVPMELVVHAADGSLHTVVAYAAALGKELAGTHLVVLYDITKERHLAEEQRKLQEQLVEAQRLESIGRLAGGIAHDFNNMLGVILGRTEIALKSAESLPGLHAHLVEIAQAAQHSANLTRQLLAYARRQSVSPQVIDPNEAIEASLGVLRLVVGENVTLTWEPGENLPLVSVEPGHLDQILTNLCANARDAITDAGKVAIRTKKVTLPEGGDSGLPPGDYVLIEVSDDGVGIEPTTLRHVFEPFFSTKSAGKGYGLGLSTVYGLARQNHGAVLVESTVGEGSVFKVFLPRAAPSSS